MASSITALDAAFKAAILARPEGEPDMFGLTHEDWRNIVELGMKDEQAAVDVVTAIVLRGESK